MPVSLDLNISEQCFDRLDGWKEIAAYLGKDVRTAHRWSNQEGMPVYRHAGSKRGAVYAYRSEIDDWIHTDRSTPGRSGWKTPVRWGALPISLIALAIAVTFWPEPGDLVEEATIRVLVSAIDNPSAQEGLDAALDAALRSELANTPGFEAMSPEVVVSTLALMKMPADTPIDRATGRQICLRVDGFCAVLAGRAAHFGPDYLLKLEVIDPFDGRTVASAEESASGASGLLPVIRQLAGKLPGLLEVGRNRLSGTTAPTEKVATVSQRALELHSAGMRLLHEFRFEEAEILFRQATDQDPEFATAHVFAYWMLVHQGKGEDEQARFHLEQALAFAGSASESERYFIEGTYSDMIERDQEAACRSYRKLAELFPDHYFAAMNAYYVCGSRLGYRKDAIRWSTRAAEQTERVDANWQAARLLSLLAKDYKRARPYVDWLSAQVEAGDAGQWVLLATELFHAEELLAAGRLQSVSLELARVESRLDELDTSLRPAMARKLTVYHLALGRLHQAEETGKEAYYPGVLPAWLAYLRGNRGAFMRHEQAFQAWLEKSYPDETERHIWLLGWNMTDFHGFAVDILFPVYYLDDTAIMARGNNDQEPLFLSLPKFEAKEMLATGNSLLDQGLPGEASGPLRQGVRWFRERGLPDTLPYFFLGSELLAVALMETGQKQAAYETLGTAAGQTDLVNSHTAPLHQRILARQALLARDLGRVEEAESLETRLEKALALADADHPILLQIRAQQDPALQIE